MFSLLIIKYLYENKSKLIKIILLSLSVICWLLYFYLPIEVRIGNYTPFGLFLALRTFLLCILTKEFIEYIELKHLKMKMISVILFIIFTALFFVLVNSECKPFIKSWVRLFYFIMPVSFFALLYSLRHCLCTQKWLIALGKLSLPIYLFNVIIFNVLLEVLLKYGLSASHWIGIIVFILTLFFCYGISILTTRVKKINKILFP
jgi:peptidoglycan/LPS O-acetylase OafA/YrhL